MSPETRVLGSASVRQCISMIVWLADLNLEALKIRQWRRGPSSDQRCSLFLHIVLMTGLCASK